MANLTPRRAMVVQCLDCIGPKRFKEKDCGDHDCPFYGLKNKKGKVSVKNHRKFCLQCINGSTKEITNCPSYECPIFDYRMGKNPSRPPTLGSGNKGQEN